MAKRNKGLIPVTDKEKKVAADPLAGVPKIEQLDNQSLEKQWPLADEKAVLDKKEAEDRAKLLAKREHLRVRARDQTMLCVDNF